MKECGIIEVQEAGTKGRRDEGTTNERRCEVKEEYDLVTAEEKIRRRNEKDFM